MEKAHSTIKMVDSTKEDGDKIWCMAMVAYTTITRNSHIKGNGTKINFTVGAKSTMIDHKSYKIMKCSIIEIWTKQKHIGNTTQDIWTMIWNNLWGKWCYRMDNTMKENLVGIWWMGRGSFIGKMGKLCGEYGSKGC